MHPSALELGERFFRAYCKPGVHKLVVEIGAQDVNGSLRSVSPEGIEYLGVDFVAGRGVDIILDDPYKLPFEDSSVDIMVCSSVFEHSEFFWLLANEMLRSLKPHGVLYVNAPSNGYIHRYPVDCWRFYPDAGLALANWGALNFPGVVMLESFVSAKKCESIAADAWNDFVAVILKDRGCLSMYPARIMNGYSEFSNGYVVEQPGVCLNAAELPDDFADLIKKDERLRELTKQLESSKGEVERIKGDLAGKQSELELLRAHLNRIEGSRSWKLLQRVGKFRTSLGL